jgi:arylsulfatase A-like enzyme
MNKPNKPNILLITSDQQHWSTLGAFNNEISTPNLDRLVKEGTTFKRAYCPNPTCTPTRNSIISGLYPSQHGAWALGTKMFESVPTIGDHFIEHGYRTALIGKAHFQPLASTVEYPSLESRPLIYDSEYWRDFDEKFYGFEHVELTRNHTNRPNVGMHYMNWLEDNGCTNWRDYFKAPVGTMSEDDEFNWTIPEKYHYNRWIAERTKQMLNNYKENDESFFLWASFFDPHPPYLVPEPWDTMYDPNKVTLPKLVSGEHDKNPPYFKKTQEERPDFSEYEESGFRVFGFDSHLHDQEHMKKAIAVYYGMISMMDKYIGRILDQLDELGLTENTIVVFTSDHGHVFGHHGLNKKGGFQYEDIVKIPFIVRYPQRVPKGRQSAAMQSLVDLAPTFLNLSGIPVPRTMAGRDQTEVWLKGKDCVRDHIICEFRNEPTKVFLKTYVEERYKITVYYNQEYGQLYDLQEDPNEINNLWEEPDYQELKKKLLLKFLWAEFGNEPLPMPRVSST